MDFSCESPCGRWLLRALVPAFVGGAIAFGPLALAQEPAAPEAGASIELRKSFRTAPRAGRQPGRAGASQVPQPPTGVSEETGTKSFPALGGVAIALGEPLQTSGTLHLPGVSGRGMIIQAAKTPIVEFGAGRRVILDPEQRIAPEVAAEIARRWPGYLVLQPPPGTGLRDILGGMLSVAGYNTILRGTPVTFGSAVTVRLRPDFVILKRTQDLLDGETRTLSVLPSAADALPAELRELAREQRIAVVELTAEGSVVGLEQEPWRDASAWVTTVEAHRPELILAEIATQLGLTVESKVPFGAAPGPQTGTAELRITRGETTVLVLSGATADSETQQRLSGGDPGVIVLADATGLSAAIAGLLRRFEVPAVGPQVEFTKAAATGEQPRFVISVPGWLAAVEGRRLLITGAAPPTPLRLYLTRQGIAIFEYRVRRGR